MAIGIYFAPPAMTAAQYKQCIKLLRKAGAGHQDLTTTQRYMHRSPAAIEGAIRLLDEAGIPSHRGNMVATGSQGNANVNQ